MSSSSSLPVAGIMLALTAFVAMLMLEIDFAIAAAILIVWIGSLLLTSGRPPETAAPAPTSPYSPDSMRKLIEDSSVPLFVTEKNKIAVANRAARQLLGQHILGQDARVAFRQPEAIALLDKKRDGQAVIRGLVRRQDIWKIKRQRLDANRAVIELINQTAEADISRAHTDFVANASHELRTPLASILGYVETLREGGDSMGTSTSQKFLATIDREGQRLQSLISDLMSLSRVEAEKHDLPTRKIELRGLTERAAKDAAGPDRKDRLTLELAENPLVQGDRGQLEQVVRNLVDNALKYGSDDSPVSITLDLAEDGMARIAVVDQGEGIEPEHIPLLTRRFYRTDPGRSRASGGTGLGLAIVKHIVERHRGRLNITSDLGKGTRVVVRLPIVERDPDHADAQTGHGTENESPPLS